ncbi:MAG: hypothetical protein ACQETE_16220 [Bacteroidota bacterium]
MKSLNILLLGLILTLPVGAWAQSAEVTKITITDGVDRFTAADLEAEVDTLLQAIRTWNTTGEDTFPEEPGSEQLKPLVQQHQLEVYYQDVQTVAVESFDGHTVPNIVLKADGEQGAEPMALALTFALDGTFLRVSADEREFSAQRILAADMPVNPDERNRVEGYLAQYRQAYQKKRFDQLSELIDETAKIVTGKQKDQRNAFDFYSYTKDEYVTYAVEKIFTDGNDISLRFDSMQVYRDPLNEQQLGIYLFQDYQSTTYSDQGYLFLLVDLSTDQPQLQFRVWRATPIRPGEYGLSEPELKKIVEKYQQPPISFYSGEIAGAALPHSSPSYGPVRYVDAVAFPTISQPSFLERNRYWIIAGAATIAGGLAYGLLQPEGSTPGIPGPPGQPAMN